MVIRPKRDANLNIEMAVDDAPAILKPNSHPRPDDILISGKQNERKKPLLNSLGNVVRPRCCCVSLFFFSVIDSEHYTFSTIIHVMSVCSTAKRICSCMTTRCETSSSFDLNCVGFKIENGQIVVLASVSN